MFACITRFQLKPGAMDEIIRRFQDSFGFGADRQPGFAGLSLLSDYQNDKVLAVGLWMTEADLFTVKSDYYPAQIARIKELLTEPPLLETYEVTFQLELTAQGAAHVRGI